MFRGLNVKGHFLGSKWKAKKPSNKGSKGLANKWQSHQAQAAGMMDHRFMK